MVGKSPFYKVRRFELSKFSQKMEGSEFSHKKGGVSLTRGAISLTKTNPF